MGKKCSCTDLKSVSCASRELEHSAVVDFLSIPWMVAADLHHIRVARHWEPGCSGGIFEAQRCRHLGSTDRLPARATCRTEGFFAGEVILGSALASGGASLGTLALKQTNRQLLDMCRP